MLKAINSVTQCKAMPPASATECRYPRRPPNPGQKLIHAEGVRWSS